MIWHQIQIANREKKDLQVIFFDLANAFVSFPHIILWAAFDFFRIPECITNKGKSLWFYFFYTRFHHHMAASRDGHDSTFPTNIYHGDGGCY